MRLHKFDQTSFWQIVTANGLASQIKVNNFQFWNESQNNQNTYVYICDRFSSGARSSKVN